MPVKVVVRFRPNNKSEYKKDTSDDLETEFFEDDTEFAIYDPKKKNYTDMTFDKVLVNNSQKDTFLSVGLNICNNVLNGKNGTIIAYGQSGSGKTYSMIGNNNNGIIINSINYILNKINNINIKSKKITFSIYEIYNNKIKDLLNDKKNNDKIMITTNSKGNMNITNIECVNINKNNISQIIMKGIKNQKKKKNLMSISHILMTLNIQYININNKKIKSELKFVDLAGFENIQLINRNINKSLSHLNDVISKLVINSNKMNKNVHVPYRNCVLTKLLKNSFQENSQTCLLVCVSQHMCNRKETINSLKFGKNFQKIKTPKTQKRAKSLPTIKMNKQNKKSKILHNKAKSLLQLKISEESSLDFEMAISNVCDMLNNISNKVGVTLKDDKLEKNDDNIDIIDKSDFWNQLL